MSQVISDLTPVSISKLPDKLFVFPVTNEVVFPGMELPINLTHPHLEIIEKAQNYSNYVAFVFYPFDNLSPSPDTISNVGTVVEIVKVSRKNRDLHKITVKALQRIRLIRFLQSEDLIAEVEYLREEVAPYSEKVMALWHNIQKAIQEMAPELPTFSSEWFEGLLRLKDPGVMADIIAANFPMPLPEKQKLLEAVDLEHRLSLLYQNLLSKLQILDLGREIREKVQEKIDESQREYFLREQLKVIRKELGEEFDDKGLSIQKFEERIQKAGLSEEALARAKEQLHRLRILMPEAAEYHMISTYLEWLLDLPWSRESKDHLDLKNARKILDQDHYGLDEVKERILEFLAVKKLKPDQKGQIICFVGPPGTGKTSLGKSITRALGRKFFRFSLGGMRDEAEIKGHRRTYIGAMPGKILQGLKRVGTRNPVFVLDEIDKLGSDWRGDPSSAMLEVLDPEQNHAFLDHYLDVPFDLSKVMFIATANTTETIPRPLLDRMEVIEISGYIDQEKIEIAFRHLIPKQLELHGLTPKMLGFTRAAIHAMIRSYTREAGVRNLERLIAKICRKVAAKVVQGLDQKIKIRKGDVELYLGPPSFIDEMISRGQAPGIAVGLAWTSVGGEIIFVETSKMEGSGSLKLTGKLGKVMSESAQLAFSYVRSNAHYFKLPPKAFDKADFHIHFPAGAVPKDGPSAGVTIATALLSLLRQQSIPPRLAMTGELTLTGNVLPVGGIKEKVIAARRAGAKAILLPHQNQRDLSEVPDYIKKDIQFYFASTYKDIEKVVFKKVETKKSAKKSEKPKSHSKSGG